MIYMVEINGVAIPQVLLQVKGIKAVRITYDDDGCPFSYHAMESETQELGYVIPEMIKFSGIQLIRREWGGEAIDKSDWVQFSY